MGYLGNNALPFDPIRSGGKPRDAERFSGNGSTTTFTLTQNTFAPTDIEVFVENVQQEPIVAYNTIGNSLVFTEAPPSGTNNVYVVYRNFDAGLYTSIPDGSVGYQKLANNIRVFTTNNFTGDNTTVAFSLSETPADANTVFVSVDGVIQLAPKHYSVSGNTITFTSAPPNSSNVHVRHLGFRTTTTVTALPANTTISQPILQNLTATGTSTFTGNISVSGTITGNLNVDSGTLFVEAPTNKVLVGHSSQSDVGTNGFAVDVNSGGNFAAFFRNSNASTPYGVWVKEPSGASSGYPLFQITESTGSTAYFRTDSGGNSAFGASPSSNSKLYVNGILRFGNYFTYGNGGYFTAAGGGVNNDFLLSTAWTGDRKIVIEWSFQWNNGTGGSYGRGTIYSNYDNTLLNFNKTAESTASPIGSTSTYKSGNNLYFRVTSSSGINGYWMIRTATYTGGLLNAF